MHRNTSDRPSSTKYIKMSPRFLCEGTNKTFTVPKQKVNDVSAHANIHSETAYDEVGEYGQGPETKMPERGASEPCIASAEDCTDKLP